MRKDVPKYNLGTRGTRGKGGQCPPYIFCWWHRLSRLCTVCGGQGRPPYRLAPDPCFSNLPVVPVVILVVVVKGPDFI
jgi:hypothetical protein